MKELIMESFCILIIFINEFKLIMIIYFGEEIRNLCFREWIYMVFKVVVIKIMSNDFGDNIFLWI